MNYCQCSQKTNYNGVDFTNFVLFQLTNGFVYFFYVNLLIHEANSLGSKTNFELISLQEISRNQIIDSHLHAAQIHKMKCAFISRFCLKGKSLCSFSYLCQIFCVYCRGTNISIRQPVEWHSRSVSPYGKRLF